MNVLVNGFPEEVPPGIKLTELIEMFKEQDHSLIVEVNGQFIHSHDYRNYQVKSGDQVELIHPAFGG